MTEFSTRKLRHVVLADPESHVRLDLGRTLLKLADTVDRFSEGEDALAFIKDRQPEIAVVALGCWMDPDTAISQVKAAQRGFKGEMVLTHRKLLPKHLGKLNKMKIEHVVGHPIDPLLIFRLAHERFGVIARRHTRIQEKRDVLWGGGPHREVIGYTTDISRGGMLMVSGKRFAKGSSFFFCVALEPGREVELRAEVRHVDEKICAPELAYGMSFIDLKTTTAMALEESIERFKHEGAEEAPITFDASSTEQE